MSGYNERGPVPKRSQARRRRNTTDEQGNSVEVEKVELDSEDFPELDPATDPRCQPNPNWHDAALAIWRSAQESGQTVFWEPSDWAILRLTCSQISQEYADDLIIEKVKEPIFDGGGGGERLVYGSRPMPAGKFAAVLKALGSLGMTEGDRRRMHVELERHGQRPDPGTADDVGKARLELMQGGRDAG